MVTVLAVRNALAAHCDLSEDGATSWRQAVPTARQGGAVMTLDTVELQVPADPAYLAVVRTATAGLAARLDLTLDEIEDLRIAVDEACALLLAGRSHPGQDLCSSFRLGEDVLDVTITGPVSDLPTESRFAWSVLHALVGSVETGNGDGRRWIRLRYVRGRQAQ
jgi:serine/threonine-protein kinase RsbW